MMSIRLCQVLGISLVWTILGAKPTYAQEAKASAEVQAPAGTQVGLEEIVVTAEHRSESLQSVPIVVSVLTSDSIAKLGSTDTMSLPTQIPTLQTSRQIIGYTVYLRGVGTISAPGDENAVATYVDDVYINGFASNIVSYNNVQRVEVLEGPQGTLFGRNATGGVIRIVTKDPSTTPELSGQIGYGNYGTITSNVYGTTGIASNLAMDVAYFSREQDTGWGRDVHTGQEINLGKEYGLRSKLKWTPGEDTAVLLEGDHYWTDYDYGTNPSVVRGTLSAGGGTFVGDYNNQADNVFSGGKSGNSAHVDGQTITVDHNFGWGTLRSISAARQVYATTSYDQDMGPANVVSAAFTSRMEQYTEEMRLSSPDGWQLGGHDFHWQGGIFAMKLNDAIAPLSLQGLALGGLAELEAFSKSYTHSYAGFVDGTYALNNTTNLTLGARYTEDRIRNASYDVFTSSAGSASAPPLYQQTNSGKPTYRVILDHRFTEDVMTYGSVSRGFKSGGFALLSAGTKPTVPEELDAYAIGAKTQWFDHRFQANVEAYAYNYKHQQVEVIVGGGAFDINAGQSRIYGLDLKFAFTPIADLTLTANYGYLHGRYSSFPGAPVYLQQPATCSPTPTRLTGALEPGDLLCSFDAAGKPTIRSPTNSGNLGADYTFLRTTHGTIDWAANYFHTSSFNWDPSGQFPERAYGLIQTSLTWKSASEKYDVQLWCTNCGNVYHDTFIAESATGQQRAPEAPREFGVKFGARFK